MATENFLLSVSGITGTSYNECVLCFQSAGTSPTNTLEAGGDLINAWIAHAQSLWLDLFPAPYCLTQLLARRAFPMPSAGAVLPVQPFSQTGQRGGGTTAQNLCPSIFLVPPMGTKSGGRIFLPCIGYGDLTDQQYLGNYVTAVDAFMTAVTTGLAGSGTNWKLAIFSRKLVSAALVLSWVLSPRVGFQGRRRKPSGAT